MKLTKTSRLPDPDNIEKDSFMAQGALSDEINRHFEAVLALSRRDILRRLLSEAELCIEFDQASAAAILAGIALEELSSLRDLKIAQRSEQTLEAWREVLNRAAHPSPRGHEVDPKAVAAMVMELRAMLDEIDRPQGRLQNSPFSDNSLTRIRGKYAFVPTSVDDFLKSKREDAEFENRK